MFSVNDTILVVDQSNFTLGVKIIAVKENNILFHTVITDNREIQKRVIDIANKMNISNIFIKPLSVEDSNKILKDYKKVLNTEFANNNKIYFHLM